MFGTEIEARGNDTVICDDDTVADDRETIALRGNETVVFCTVEYAHDIDCDDKNAYYLFSVRDNGIGIPEKYHATIFKPLKRLHSQDEIEGSGLGLAICEKAVQAHGGRIWIEPNTGEGSVFFFTIPKFLG